MPLVIFTNPHAWGQSSEGRLAQEAKWWIKIKHQDIKYVGINLMKYVWNLYILKNNNGEIKEKLNGVFKKIPTREAGWALSPGTGQTCQRAESILKSLCRKQNLTFCCLHSRTFRSISFLVIMVKKKIKSSYYMIWRMMFAPQSKPTTLNTGLWALHYVKTMGGIMLSQKMLAHWFCS